GTYQVGEEIDARVPAKAAPRRSVGPDSQFCIVDKAHVRAEGYIVGIVAARRVTGSGNRQAIVGARGGTDNPSLVNLVEQNDWIGVTKDHAAVVACQGAPHSSFEEGVKRCSSIGKTHVARLVEDLELGVYGLNDLARADGDVGVRRDASSADSVEVDQRLADAGRPLGRLQHRINKKIGRRSGIS